MPSGVEAPPKEVSRGEILTTRPSRTLPAGHRRRYGRIHLHPLPPLKAADYGDSGLVFATGKGTPLDAQNMVNRFFKPLLQRAGLPDIRWHDLRHTYATLLLARGTHPTYVQKSLGHASVQLTLDRYSHWMPSMGRSTAQGIDEALG